MKKQILTFVFMATVAVATAYAGHASKSKSTTIDAKPFGSTLPCNIPVECSPVPGPACTVDQIQYGANNPDTGLCDRFLSFN